MRTFARSVVELYKEGESLFFDYQINKCYTFILWMPSSSHFAYSNSFPPTRKKSVSISSERRFTTCRSTYNLLGAFKGKGGSVSMTDNTEIEVSTRRKDELLKRLTEL
jgi:hypothetical protein